MPAKQLPIMLGCSAVLAVPAFIVTFVITLVVMLVAQESFLQSLLVSLILATTTAVATILAMLMLSSRDFARHVRAKQDVQRGLISRADMSDEKFAAHFPETDLKLLIHIRVAVASFFDVPPEKVYPTDRLREDLRWDVLDPGFAFFVIEHVLAARGITGRRYGINTSKVADFACLAREIRRIMKGDRPGRY